MVYVICVSWSHSQDLPRVHSAFDQAFVEIAESMYMSRNIAVALLALQSWKSFVSNWMQAVVSLLDIKEPSKLNKAMKAANDIFKVYIYIFSVFLVSFVSVCSTLSDSTLIETTVSRFDVYQLSCYRSTVSRCILCLIVFKRTDTF